MPAPHFLYLDALVCRQDSGEWLSQDSPSLLLFVGEAAAGGRADLLRIGSPQWQGAVSAGTHLQTRTWVHADVRPRDWLIVALVEEDGRADLADGRTADWPAAAAAAWHDFLARSPAHAPVRMRQWLARLLTHGLHDDDMLAVQSLQLGPPGLQPPMVLRGHRAHYEAGFRLVDTTPR